MSEVIQDISSHTLKCEVSLHSEGPHPHQPARKDVPQLPAALLDDTPFRCPICFELYGGDATLPTTLPCGHSCCLSHVAVVRDCCVCRHRLPPATALCPTYSLRDGALVHEALMRTLRQYGAAPPVDERPAPVPVLPAADRGHMHAVAPAPSREEQIEADEFLARRLHDLLNARPHPAAAAAAAQAPRPVAAAAAVPIAEPRTLWARFRAREPAAAVAGAAGSPRLTHKACGHQCTLGTAACCACTDRRPAQPEGSYAVYRDGHGWVNTGQRRDGYCVVCRDGPRPNPVVAPSAPRLAQKACGHHCTLLATHACCACTDRRPAQPEGSYAVYRDGHGWVNTGRRRDGYCMHCR